MLRRPSADYTRSTALTQAPPCRTRRGRRSTMAPAAASG